MKYQGNYRLVTNPRAKMSHSLRALLKKRERIEAAKHTPINRETIGGHIYCKSCGKPITGSSRYHEQCDRCYRKQMRDTNGIEVAK